MEIARKQIEGAEILIVEGNIDIVTAPKLQAELESALSSTAHLVLDFNGVRYMSSAGLRVLLSGQKISQSKNKSMVLKNIQKEVMEVFDVTGFTSILTIEQD
ncbi:MAG: STAS domain-containing protein [Oscillospiraceae bacterium]|nr:STAS domain-containing protein [Oscillospiraceae bacterium]